MPEPLEFGIDPAAFPLAVLLRRRPSSNRWLRYHWETVGVVVTSRRPAAAASGQPVCSHPDGAEDFLWGGFSLHLHRDEAESYYYNLLAPEPALYVIQRADDAGRPQPFLVTASFDEANAYVEGDAQAQPVAMPPEIYRWIERFVLCHYQPQPRRKRKRENWKEVPGEHH